MKIVRLLEFRKQQEQQAKGVLSQRVGQLREELNRLQSLKEELLRTENLSFQQVEFPVALLQQRACYLDRLQGWIREQQEQVKKSRDRVQQARAKWEECRLEKEKMEKLMEKWEERQREREKVLTQRYLDEIGTLRFIDGNQC